MTDQEFARWLRADDARRCVLLEIDMSPTVRLAVVPYTTLPTDPQPHVRYDAVVRGGVGYDESLDTRSGRARASYASIELHNEDGSLDGWIDLPWHNRAIRIYYGDARWGREDFRLVAAGVVDRIEARRSSLSIVLMDKAARLDAAVTDELLGGTGQDADRLVPVTLGECHNVTPRLYAAGLHKYRFHRAAAERVIEVRDNGVPVDFAPEPGGFRLLQSPKGEITASVQGDTTGGIYRNTVAALVRLLATEYGNAQRFTAADLDAANLDAFEAAHPQPVGLYLADRATVMQCIVDLAASVGAQPVMSRTGLLRLLKIELPAPGTPTVIRPHDYELGSLEIAGQIPPIAGVRLGYCRNWAAGQQIAEGVPTEHRDLYAQEWLTRVARSTVVAGEWRIDTETEQVNTLLLRGTDAEAEAARRLALWSVPRQIVRVTGFAQLLTLELGQPVTLYGDRYGLDAGRTGQVVGLKPDWTAGRCAVEVLL